MLQAELPDEVYCDIIRFWEYCNFDDTIRLVHFLAQCAHESGNFIHKKETLNFALDKGKVLRLFSTRLVGKEDKVDFHFEKFSQNEIHPDEHRLTVAELVYGGRVDLGNTTEGDGRLFIGRGYIQLTGRCNYERFVKYLKENRKKLKKSLKTKDIDCISRPELVEKHYAMLSAIWYFHHKDLFPICSKGLDDEVIMEVTILVNGKLNGLKDRIAWTRYYERLLEDYL